jgi:hypothetical protein
LNKKRDALRRGIRDLLQDTSRDLVAFEGREAGEVRPQLPATPAAPPPAHDAVSLPVEAVPDRPAAVDLPPEHPEVTVSLNGGTAKTPHLAEAPHAAEPSRSAEPPRAAEAPERAEPPQSAEVPPAPPRTASRTAPAKRPKPDTPRSTPPGRASQTQRGARDGRANDIGAEAAPAPAESRTGVCRAYYVDHECWRVPTAYCNTALQVCVIRNCPVYHLHKAALERRFSKKFKHLW